MTKGEEKSGNTAIIKSESCSCACGKIATSSVLSTTKHQQMFAKKSGVLMLIGLMKMTGMLMGLTDVIKTQTSVLMMIRAGRVCVSAGL